VRDDIEYDGSGDDNNRLNIDLKRDLEQLLVVDPSRAFGLCIGGVFLLVCQLICQMPLKLFNRSL
jgi:hypothetical protein